MLARQCIDCSPAQKNELSYNSGFVSEVRSRSHSQLQLESKHLGPELEPAMESLLLLLKELQQETENRTSPERGRVEL